MDINGFELIRNTNRKIPQLDKLDELRTETTILSDEEFLSVYINYMTYSLPKDLSYNLGYYLSFLDIKTILLNDTFIKF